MTSPRAPSAAGELGRFLLAVIAVSVGLAALGYLPTRRLAGAEGIVAMGAALVVVGLASAAGGVPVFLARRAARPKPQIVLSSMLVRLVVVVVLSLPMVWWAGVVAGPFLVWLVIAYLALLVVDTLYAMRAMGSL
ncbi:MAG: hypothetical protein R3244_01175 [Thermoanaerobaculia bacterium]|nr:hypothetical protein [Thermoanaerobaculia bacterium]